jgi:putative ABC transport system permease protein
MALITLKDIGKIYVSGGNVAVGIRGVNLSFERGEFVAITGTSGSGKSTLLNVISGMDSYEEGELYIQGEPTSHYEQRDWEDYRRKYISFIFQDYNIIESFTVLQNVELALTHIDNPKLRRQRALELLRRVGLENHLHHKGSKLSGGQKQRTVIARALAKDSPVILADEPTGNLDSQTSKEIIQLLREVSKEKLVIVVTHNFEQVEAYATRHIRVFDGAVESDQHLSANTPAVAEIVTADAEQTPPLRKRRGEKLRSGLTLGRARFFATPKLSIFLCILMIFSALAMTLVTSLKGGAALRLADKDYLFTHQTGRTVLIRRDGAVISDEELESLAGQVGATSTLHYDFLLDTPQNLDIGDNTYEISFA